VQARKLEELYMRKEIDGRIALRWREVLKKKGSEEKEISWWN